MADASEARRAVLKTRWVHADGDDTEAGAIFRDSAADLPLSRRPREFLEFSDDGTVRRFASGADDRAREVDRTRWSDEGGQIVFRFETPNARGAREYRVVEHGAGRLVVRRE